MAGFTLNPILECYLTFLFFFGLLEYFFWKSILLSVGIHTNLKH